MCHVQRASTVAVGGEHEPPLEPTEPTDAEWISLLTDDEEGAPSSCERALGRTPPRMPHCASRAPSVPRVRAPIPPRIIARLHREGEDDVVWIATHLRENGMQLGIVAITRRTSIGLEVQAMGPHEGPSENAELRLLRTGSGVIVSVEADRGEARVARFLIQSGGSLVQTVIDGTTDEDCQDPGEIVLRRIEEIPHVDGWTSRVVRTATLEERSDGVLVREHLTIHELDRRNPDARVRATHDANAIRLLVPSGVRLRAQGPPLDVHEIIRP